MSSGIATNANSIKRVEESWTEDFVNGKSSRDIIIDWLIDGDNYERYRGEISRPDKPFTKKAVVKRLIKHLKLNGHIEREIDDVRKYVQRIKENFTVAVDAIFRTGYHFDYNAPARIKEKATSICPEYYKLIEIFKSSPLINRSGVYESGGPTMSAAEILGRGIKRGPEVFDESEDRYSEDEYSGEEYSREEYSGEEYSEEEYSEEGSDDEEQSEMYNKITEIFYKYIEAKKRSLEEEESRRKKKEALKKLRMEEKESERKKEVALKRIKMEVEKVEMKIKYQSLLESQPEGTPLHARFTRILQDLDKI